MGFESDFLLLGFLGGSLAAFLVVAATGRRPAPAPREVERLRLQLAKAREMSEHWQHQYWNECEQHGWTGVELCMAYAEIARFRASLEAEEHEKGWYLESIEREVRGG